MRNKLFGGWEPPVALVMPQKYRVTLLRLSHESTFAALLGVARTKKRLTQHFCCSGIGQMVRDYCHSCHICQSVGKRGDKIKAKWPPLPLIDVPFKRIGIDIIGPLPKGTKRGKICILAIVDFATSYPEAIMLPSIATTVVVEALLTVFFRLGFPSEIQKQLALWKEPKAPWCTW